MSGNWTVFLPNSDAERTAILVIGVLVGIPWGMLLMWMLVIIQERTGRAVARWFARKWGLPDA